MISMLKNSFLNLSKVYKYPIFWVFLSALIIRLVLVGIDMPFIFHPDEPTVVHSTQNLKYSLNPKHFDWPNFYYYLNAPFYFVLETAHTIFKRLGWQDLSTWVVDRSSYYLVSRSLTAIFGALTSITIYFIVKNITKNTSISLTASILMALIPFHITRSAQALTDVPMLFLLTLSVYFITRNFDGEKKWNYYFSFFFAGLAISTKYNAYLIYPTLLLFLFWVRPFKIKDWFFYVKCGFLTFFGFFVGTPYAVFDFKTFIRSDSYVGVLWQFTNVGKVELFDQVYFFFYNLFLNIGKDFGYLIYYFALVFIIYFVVSLRNKKLTLEDKFILILIVQLFYFIWVVSGLRVQRTHYFITLYFIPPIFTAIFLYRYRVLEKITIFFQALYASYIIFQSLYPSVHLQLYQTLRFTSDPKSSMFFSSEQRATAVLKKLDLPNSKMNPTFREKLKEYSFFLTDNDACEAKISCEYSKIKTYWDFEGGVLHIYEIKK